MYEEDFQRIRDHVDKIQRELDCLRQELNYFRSKLEYEESEPKISAKVASEPPTSTISLRKSKSAISPQVNHESSVVSTISLGKGVTNVVDSPIDNALAAEYNSLLSVDSNSIRLAREDFIKRHGVIGFECANFYARINEPIPPPEFKSANNPFAGDYWGVPVGDSNQYDVLPNVGKYNDNAHFMRAMETVFNSNFEAGGSYSKIRVVTPATFTRAGDDWNIISMGRLILEA